MGISPNTPRPSSPGSPAPFSPSRPPPTSPSASSSPFQRLPPAWPLRPRGAPPARAAAPPTPRTACSTPPCGGPQSRRWRTLRRRRRLELGSRRRRGQLRGRTHWPLAPTARGGGEGWTGVGRGGVVLGQEEPGVVCSWAVGEGAVGGRRGMGGGMLPRSGTCLQLGVALAQSVQLRLHRSHFLLDPHVNRLRQCRASSWGVLARRGRNGRGSGARQLSGPPGGPQGRRRRRRRWRHGRRRRLWGLRQRGAGASPGFGGRQPGCAASPADRGDRAADSPGGTFPASPPTVSIPYPAGELAPAHTPPQPRRTDPSALRGAPHGRMDSWSGPARSSARKGTLHWTAAYSRTRGARMRCAVLGLTEAVGAAPTPASPPTKARWSDWSRKPRIAESVSLSDWRGLTPISDSRAAGLRPAGGLTWLPAGEADSINPAVPTSAFLPSPTTCASPQGGARHCTQPPRCLSIAHPSTRTPAASGLDNPAPAGKSRSPYRRGTEVSANDIPAPCTRAPVFPAACVPILLSATTMPPANRL
eukprot:scaffold6019_cov84-Isochrysis_galbana.AAC.3